MKIWKFDLDLFPKMHWDLPKPGDNMIITPTKLRLVDVVVVAGNRRRRLTINDIYLDLVILVVEIICSPFCPEAFACFL